MNTFPYTSFSQNVGLVGVTGVRSRWVTVTGGIIMILMGLVPKLGALAEAIPLFVLGGAGIVMFGMVAATGIRILSDVDYKTSRFNLYIVALSVGFGLIPLVAPAFFNKVVAAVPTLGPILHSGILLTAFVAVLLNLFFNGVGSREDAVAGGAAHDARQRVTAEGQVVRRAWNFGARARPPPGRHAGACRRRAGPRTP